MMRTAHFIITYTDPRLTERVIKRMDHPDFDFYIHVDKKVAIEPYRYLQDLGNVFFIRDRVDVKWAGYSTIEATFNGIREICEKKEMYNYINLLSGQDYPLKSAFELADFFKTNEGKEFLLYYDYNKWPEGHLRYQRYFLSDYSFKGRHLIEKVINGVLPKRKMPYGFHPYGLCMFWMLSPAAAQYVVDTLENDLKLRRFFFYTWASDEFLFQTVLMNSPFRDQVVNNNYRYYDWSARGPHPKLLVDTDFEKIRKSKMLFSRKFDIGKDERILDLIDKELIYTFRDAL
ncbi:beta-1,6-N-acetylglucosaminyltransferase [Parapedobacter sp. DT-150]|uniref:beta-1,6-N-acetylglucosaminyltransferase n=1 Tax=Parapedobacter sp. DT-150 TaxID=3396162 RepID=UPI003F1C9555